MNHSLTATNLSIYQHLNCDLYIHNVYTGATASASPEGSSSPSEFTKAHYKRGLDWESVLYTWLDRSNLLLRIPSIPLEASDLLENILYDDRTHFFIAGITFWPPQAELEAKFKAASTASLGFGLAKPDLLEIHRTKDGIEWRVIDAKASHRVKASHHTQIYFYTMCLNFILRGPSFRGQDSAGVWLPPKGGFQENLPSLDDITSVSLSLLSPPMDTLFFKSIPKVVALPQENVKWHFNPLCRGCKYEPTCRTRALDQGELGSMPNISIDEAKALKDLLRMSRDNPRKTSGLTDIEELHNLVSKHHKLTSMAKSSPSLVRKAKQILSLPKKVPANRGPMLSPLLEAARKKQIQVIPRRNYTCPRVEDIAVFISVVNDPSSHEMGGSYFHVASFSRKSNISVPTSIFSDGEDFIPKLSNLIRTIDSSSNTSQFYVWSLGEQLLLQSHIINAALTGASEPDIRLCIGALCQGASLLQTNFQPLLLSGSMISFLGKGRNPKANYQKCLEQLGLSTEGAVDVLRKRFEAEIRRLQENLKSTHNEDGETRQKELGQLLRVVVLKKEIERQLALPVPGYWDLPECVVQLLSSSESEGLCPDDGQIWAAYRGRETEDLNCLLNRRSEVMYGVLKELRLRAVSAAGRSLFVNEAKRISTEFMDFCSQPHIRKLFFMQQFEVLAKLAELWQSRIDGCPEAPTIEYRGFTQGKGGQLHKFRVLSGTVDVPSTDKERAFYDKLLVVDTPVSLTSNEGGEDKLPVEALFDDLGVSGLVFPLNGYTQAKWTRQDPRVQQEVWIADTTNIYMDPRGLGTTVTLRTWSTHKVPFVSGAVYRLSPRLVDFNTTKVLSALFEHDLEWKSAQDDLPPQEKEASSHGFVPFLQLILDPGSFGQVPFGEQYVKIEKDIQTTFRTLRDLGDKGAGSLVLKASQHHATKRIMANRLSVIWGPPGTGKTYTISLSLLLLIDVEIRRWGPQRKTIFISAVTHAAIEACRNKLVQLLDTYRAIPNLPNKWIDDVSVEVVGIGNDHPGPRKSGNAIHVYMGTIYQLYNFTKKHNLEVDSVIIDEAGQISLSSVSLVLRSLRSCGRIIIAGDSEQLAPILSAQYPLLKAHALFGSILDCLMFPRTVGGESQPVAGYYDSQDSVSPSESTVIQLTENFRLNPDLGEFVSTIYSRKFKPQKSQARQLASALQTISGIDSKGLYINDAVFIAVQKFLTSLATVMSNQPQDVLAPPEIHSNPSTNLRGISEDDALDHQTVSLALVRLRTWSAHTQNISYELHVQAEAALAAALVISLQRCSPKDDIFVATPHRIQREAVKAALSRIRLRKTTRKRLQIGEEAMTEVVCPKVTVDTIERLQGSEASFVICLFSVPKTYAADLGFLLERRRLNVAISRAKTLCIFVSSDEVLCPSVKILANAEMAKGYAFLKAFQKRAWSCYLPLKVDGLQA